MGAGWDYQAFGGGSAIEDSYVDFFLLLAFLPAATTLDDADD